MNRIRTMFVVLAAALAAGCGSDEARLTVLLKDAPATDLSVAWVTITDINLVGSNGTTRIGPAATVTVDLLTLANQTAELVKDAVVAPGRYTELRFVVAGGCIEVAGSWYASSPNGDMPGECTTATGALRMPSMGQSGLKVTMSGDALNVAAGSKVLVVDFDVAQSFGVEAGNSGAWVMHPVITGGDISLSGNVLATVALGTGFSPTAFTPFNCTVSLTPAATATNPTPTPLTATIATGTGTATTGIGSAQFYPPPGSYTPAIACVKLTTPTTTPLIVTATSTPAGTLTVSPGQASPITFTITALQ
jgi:hypothetical protein